jgi:hypothetical protein
MHSRLLQRLLAVFPAQTAKLATGLKAIAHAARPAMAPAVLAAALLPVPLYAADGLDMGTDIPTFTLRLGMYDMNLSTRIRVDGRGGNVGTGLDFEDDLNLDDNKDTFNAALRWHFKERHFLELEHFSLKRNGFRRLEGEIRFGETVFPIGADVSSSFTTEVTRFSYAYRLVRNENWGVALGVGIHVTRLRATLTEVAFDNIEVPVTDTEFAAVTAPLPVFGFSGARRLSKKWALVARAQFFAVEVDDIDGSIKHAAMHFEHDTRSNLGFGIGYDWFEVGIKTEERLWAGKADIRFHGPMLFLKGSF